MSNPVPSFKDLLLKRKLSSMSSSSDEEDGRPLVGATASFDRAKVTASGYKPSFTLPVQPPPSFAQQPQTQARDYASKVSMQPPVKHDDDEDEDDEPVSSKYKISNLITLFNKSNIELSAIFTYKKRVVLLQVIHEAFNYFLYVPSKYEMYIDRSLGIATYDLNDDEEDDTESKESEDTLFYSKLPIQNLRREKKSKCKNLTRFLPLVSESPIKILYIEEGFLCYINRYNEIDSMILSSPFKSSGYFFMTDLEFFFKNLTKLVDEFSKFEKALTEAVYDKLTVEVDAARAAVANAQRVVSELNPKEEKKTFAKKVVKLSDYYADEKHRAKAKTMLLSLRSKNLKKMFDIENLTYVMKEFK